MGTTLLNTRPIFMADVSKGITYVSSETSTPDPGSDELLLLFEAGNLGALIESIQIHYLNWGAQEPANALLLYSQKQNSSVRSCIRYTTIAANTDTAALPAPVAVTLPPILYGDSKTALKLSAGEKLFVALTTSSTAGFNVVAIGGNYG
jgi:hypothetical protein